MNQNQDENQPIKQNDNVMHDILTAMSEAQKVFTDSTSKKMFVMRILKKKLGEDSYGRYEPMISVTIDFFKTLTKNKKLLDVLKRDSNLCLSKILSCTIV